MKKLFIVLFSLMSVSLSAQFTTTYPSLQVPATQVTGLDALFLFDGISLSSEIKYIGAGTDIRWKLFDGTEISNQSEFSPEDGEGYILNVDGRDSLYIWVIDYAKYRATLSALHVVEADDKCDYIKIVPDWIVPDLIYKDKSGATHKLARTFILSYNATEFTGDTWPDPIQKELKRSAPFSELVIDAPFCDTEFTLTGDDWAQQLGEQPVTATSGLYSAIAVESHVKGTVEERGAKNELERSGNDVSGSGPLVVLFESRTNQLSSNFYEWYIFPIENPTNYVRYDDKDVRYTFNESGDYRARLVASSGVCEYVDSIDVKVLASSLEVPNVFTPNGDGVNDEFRVAYKSLESFSCYVYNRWGRKVFHTTDPGKGWDGTINGKPAAPGAYYYIIQATGTDLDQNGKQVKYKLSGDINLLRGKK